MNCEAIQTNLNLYSMRVSFPDMKAFSSSKKIEFSFEEKENNFICLN